MFSEIWFMLMMRMATIRANCYAAVLTTTFPLDCWEAFNGSCRIRTGRGLERHEMGFTITVY